MTVTSTSNLPWYVAAVLTAVVIMRSVQYLSITVPTHSHGQLWRVQLVAAALMCVLARISEAPWLALAIFLVNGLLWMFIAIRCMYRAAYPRTEREE